jgi:hypothetical protein
VSVTDLYPNRLRKAQGAVVSAAEAWLEDVKAQFNLLQTTASGRVYPRDTLGQALQLSKGLAQANVKYAQGLVGASLAMVTAAGQEANRAGHAVMDDVKRDVGSAATRATRRADRLEDEAVAGVEELEAETRRAQKAARDAAADRYRHMTKVELSSELASRQLPKSGNVAELRQRLMQDDRQAG